MTSRSVTLVRPSGRPAREILNRARSQLGSAGDAAARAVGAARDKTPEKPGFWDKVGDVAEDLGAGLENLAGYVVNGFASFGNAVVHHPADLAATAAGVGLMALGAGAEVGGFALDATGGGAVLACA